MGFGVVKNISYKRGFTLLEMSIVLIIISIVSVGAMVVFAESLAASQSRDTAAKLVAIQNALYEFRTANNRLPCPADVTLALTHANFGVEVAGPGSCSSANYVNTAGLSTDPREGMVPTRTLRLPDDYAIDSWGRRIMYAVAKDMTLPNAMNIFSVPC